MAWLILITMLVTAMVVDIMPWATFQYLMVPCGVAVLVAVVALAWGVGLDRGGHE